MIYPQEFERLRAGYGLQVMEALHIYKVLDLYLAKETDRVEAFKEVAEMYKNQGIKLQTAIDCMITLEDYKELLRIDIDNSRQN